jgi:hypothetical protein
MPACRSALRREYRAVLRLERRYSENSRIHYKLNRTR